MTTAAEQLKLEQEAGRKALADNQAAYEAALETRRKAEEAEAALKAAAAPEQSIDEGMAEATAEAEAQAVAAGKGRGFPRAKQPYQPNQKE